MTAREIYLTSYPQGVPTLDNFAVQESALKPLEEGEALVENLAFSLDPYMRGRMTGRKTYIDPFELGKALEGGVVSRVVESKSEDLPVGSLVLGMHGWREKAVVSASAVQKLPELPVPPSYFLGTLGMTGLTAWVGLKKVAKLKEGETLYVSSAAGAVGSVVGQIAQQMGARVIGSAGSDAKVEHLKSLGFDEAFNYKTEHPYKALERLAPDGIDVYFDNVGGETLEAAIAHMNTHGRIAVCGMISIYNATEMPPAPRNLGLVISKRLHIQGFLVGDYWGDMKEFAGEMAPLVLGGKIQVDETIREGLDAAPQAFLDVMSGQKRGKMIVKLP